jgi:hypothetical protein
MMTHLLKRQNWLRYSALLLMLLPIPAMAGPTYYYVVTTVDVNGFESAFSNQATALFAKNTDGSPQHTANMTWTPPVLPAGGSAIAGYNIYRGTASGGPYVKVNAVLVTSVTYADTFVLPNAPSGLVATTQ